MHRPSGRSAGRSLAEWTPKSASPRRSASSISLTNMAFTLESAAAVSGGASGLSRLNRSPLVLMKRKSTLSPGWSSSKRLPTQAD